MLNKTSFIITSLLAITLLSGCGGSDTKIVERDSIPVDDDHDDEPLHQGRLLISLKDEPKVQLVDINEKAMLEEFTVDSPASALYSSPTYRYGFIVQRTADKVNVIDGGAFQEDHGDHMDDIIEAPQWMNFQTDYARPTHFTNTNSQTAIFFDGNVDTSTPAAVVVLNETDLAENRTGTWLEYTTHMHGAAQARGDYLLSTVRDPVSTTTLPDRVAVYRNQNGSYAEEEIFAETCPSLHGSAQNETDIAFGCTDGVLLITQSGDDFTASKIANPASFTSSTRVGTLLGHHTQADFVGIASGQFFAVGNGTLTEIDWIDSSQSTTPVATAYGYAEDGELFVILDNLGWITLLDTANWSVINRIQAITSNLSTLPEGSRFELALTPGHIIYVSDPIANQIKQIDLDQGEVSDTIQLTIAPHKITWLGIAEPAGSEHDH